MKIDVRIRIQGDERSLATADKQWIFQSIHAQSVPGKAPCVEVSISAPEISLRLRTHCCSRGGAGRTANEQEKAVIQLWERFYLGEPDADLDCVWPFLGRLRQHLGFRAA